MDHRIRVALGMATPDKFTGHVEADETFIGGKARNMHASKRARRITGTGGKDKTAVMGILERGKDGTSKVRTSVIPNRRKRRDSVRSSQARGGWLRTLHRCAASYNGLEREYAHQVIDHAVKYVEGKVHTNGLENFWSLLKRGDHSEPTSVSSRSTCSATSMSRHSDSTIGR